jgi:hypothetical protein
MRYFRKLLTALLVGAALAPLSFQGPGSSGGPALQNFGKVAAGQPRARTNQIVAVLSYRRGDVGAPVIIGLSTLNDEFTAIFDQACADHPLNCDP